MEILTVVENEKLKTVLDKILARENHTVKSVSDPITALKLAMEKKYCIIFNFEDFPLHWKFVYEYAKKQWGEINFILLTGRTFILRDRAEAASVGITANIPWNVDVKSLADYLLKVLKALE